MPPPPPPIKYQMVRPLNISPHWIKHENPLQPHQLVKNEYNPLTSFHILFLNNNNLKNVKLFEFVARKLLYVKTDNRFLKYFKHCQQFYCLCIRYICFSGFSQYFSKCPAVIVEVHTKPNSSFNSYSKN